MAKGIRGPGGGFVGVARGAGIGDFVFVGHGGRDERKGVGAHLHVRDGGFDFGHVAGDATACGRSLFVMSMLFNGAGARPVQRKRAVAV